MKYWKQGFYDEPVEGGVEITDERWLELIDGQAAGMPVSYTHLTLPTNSKV